MPGKKPTVNRRRKLIEKEKAAKRTRRKNLIIGGLKLAAYVLVLVLAYPYIVNSSFFKPEVSKTNPSETATYDEPEIEYNFYSLLPGEKTVEPPLEFSHTAEHDLSEIKAYMLQVGSFKNHKRALKLERILQGYKFNNIVVDKVKSNDTIWHRVSLGPLDSLKLAKEYRASLSLKGIHNSVIKTWNIKNSRE